MNIKYVKCGGCGVEKVGGTTGWFRSFGVFAGAPEINMSPAMNMIEGKPQALPARQVKPPQVDICEECGTKMTFELLKSITANSSLYPFAPTPAQVMTEAAPAIHASAAKT